MAYKPKGPFAVPMKVLNPVRVNNGGQVKKEYPDPATISDDKMILGSFRTFGGTDTLKNGVLSVENTAKVETYWNPEITSESRLQVLENGQIYEIIADPEDIEMRHQFMVLKLRRLKGGA